MLDELVEEFTSLSDVSIKFEAIHVLGPLSKLVLHKLYLLKQLHLQSLLFSHASHHFQSQLVTMRAFNGIRLVSIHWVVRLRVLKVLIRG